MSALRIARLALLVLALGTSSLAGQPASSGAPADPAPADSSTAEQMVAKCAQALGGEAAWQAVETLELAGRHTSFSHTEPFRLQRKRPDLYRFDHNESTFKTTVAYDGEHAWWRADVPLFSKASWPVEMPRPYHVPVATEAELSPPCVDFAAKGHRIESAGETRFEGGRYLELQIRRRQDPAGVERWFLDPETYLPALRLTQGAYHGYATEQISYFDDYRPVGGVLLPHRVETELGNDFLVQEVESARLNVEIDDAVFARPLPVGMDPLRSLAGRWQVAIESLDDPAVHPERMKTWQHDETVATIHSREGGSLLEEEIEVATPRPRRVRRLLTYDRFRGVYRLAHFDSYSQHLDVLEGTLEDGRLVLTNRRADTPIRIYAMTIHTREVFHDIGPDSFRLDREVSMDGGEHWGPDIRFTYTRIRE